MKGILGFLFFLSGIAGLVYEVSWSRYLSLTLGSTTQAHTVVLAAFLAGLALGNYAFGKWSARFKNPVLAYAGLELGIAILCACYPLAHRWTQALYFASGFELLSSFPFRAAISAALLMIPTFLMGGTFPVLIRAFAGDFQETQKMTGLLYAVNSLGAVIGSAASSLWLIQNLGLDLTMLSGAAISGLSGLGALLLAPRAESAPEESLSTKNLNAGPDARSGEPFGTVLQFRWMAAAAFLSGFTALVLEIVWFRFFALILGSTLYSFSLMLSAFILGITLGSFFASRPLARNPTAGGILRSFGFCQLSFGLAMVLSFPLYPRLPYYFIHMASSLKHSEDNFWIYQTFTFGFCFILMLLPTFFSGAALPMASQWISSYKRRASEGVGIAFSSNLAGTLAGSMAAGLVFLPLFGIEGALKVSALLAIACGAISFRLARDPRGQASQKWAMVPGIALAAAIGLMVFGKNDWKESLVLMNPYFSWRNAPPPSYADFKRGLDGSKILFYKDGAESTVAVVEHGGRERVLKINGKTDASAYGDLGTELMLGHLPMLLRPERSAPTSALCIGYGSGISAGAALRHPNTQLDLVEISPEVMEAAPFFGNFNHQAERDPNAAVAVDDAKSFLARNRKIYNVILSEPSNPRMPGVANLFTREFFELCSRRLEDDGLMVQWFHLYSMTDETVQMILRTFQTVFPHVSVWNSQAYDMMVVGSKKPLAVNFEILRERMSVPAVRDDLARIGITVPVSLLVHELVSGPGIEQIAGLGRLHTDFYPQLEFGAAKSQYMGSLSTFLFRYDQRKAREPDLLLARYLQGRSLTREELKGLLNLWFADWHHTPANAALVMGLLEEIRRRPETGLREDPIYKNLLDRLASQRGKIAPTGFLFRRGAAPI